LSASPVAIEALLVVLPTPPLPEVITIILAKVLSRLSVVVKIVMFKALKFILFYEYSNKLTVYCYL